LNASGKHYGYDQIMADVAGRARRAIVFAVAMGCAACRSRSAGLGAPPVAEAMRGLERGEITATLDTGQGAIVCRLDRHAPRALALFVGFATGRAKWRDPGGEIISRPLYQDRRFFRAIPGVLVQTGCPRDDGTGDPGFRIEVETDPGDVARLARPGALVMARYTPPPGRPDPDPPPPEHVIGSQFGFTLADMRHLAGQVTVLGSCENLDVVGRIADRVAHGERPLLARVRISAGPPTAY
jgi:peptidyl-prolyl cis-trans isomerase A (cyclophilin A)